jgi:SAM-dependent methyltransferase
MVFANNIPAQSEFDSYYESFSKYETESTEPIVTGMYPFVTECICEIINTEHKVMDIGCGYGNILRELSGRGFHSLTGIDPSMENIQSLSQSGKIKGVCSSLFSYHSESFEKQDCIILTGVLEHVVDLTGAVIALYELVAEGGVVLVGVPDIEQFTADINSPFREFSVEHINYFSKHSLITLFSQFNLTFERQWLYSGFILASFRKTSHIKSCVLEYIQQCDEIISRKVAKTKDFRFLKKPILIWGAGTLTQYLLANTPLKDCNIKCFIDSNEVYHGKRLLGLEIISPSCLLDDQYHGIPIVISTFVHSHQIMHFIRNELALANEIIIL